MCCCHYFCHFAFMFMMCTSCAALSLSLYHSLSLFLFPSLFLHLSLSSSCVCDSNQQRKLLEWQTNNKQSRQTVSHSGTNRQRDRQTGKQNARIAKAFASAKAKRQTGWPNDKIDKYSLYSRATYVYVCVAHTFTDARWRPEASRSFLLARQLLFPILVCVRV